MAGHSEALAWYRKQVRLIEAHLELNPDDARACIMGASANANIGDEEALGVLRGAGDGGRSRGSDAALQRGLHLRDRWARSRVPGLRWSRRSDKGLGDKAWIEHDSDLEAIHDEPRFQALMQAM